MIPITTQELKRNIQEALEAGVPESRIERMKDCLNKLESGVFANQKSTGLMYREIVRDGKKIIEMASAPILPEDPEKDPFDELDDRQQPTIFDPSSKKK